MPSELDDIYRDALKVLMGVLKDAFALVDASGRILLTNRPELLSDQDSLGHTGHLEIGFQIFRPDGQPYEAPESPVLRTIRTGESVVDEEFFCLAEDGSRRHFILNSAPVYRGDGHMRGAVVVLRDIRFVSATAVDHAQMDQRLEAARQTERSRIARDLHDVALSELADALAVATVARTTATDEWEALRWAPVIEVLQRVAHRVRAAVYDLRLAADEKRPFPDRLTELVAAEAGVAVGLEVTLLGQDGLPARSLEHRGSEVLLIVGQAIANARRHSGASTIQVDAARSSRDVLRLDVTDDGEWRDRDRLVSDRDRVVSSRGGTGIAGMFDRAEGLGARLQIGGTPTGGTRVSLELPLTEGRNG